MSRQNGPVIYTCDRCGTEGVKGESTTGWRIFKYAVGEGLIDFERRLDHSRDLCSDCSDKVMDVLKGRDDG